MKQKLFKEREKMKQITFEDIEKALLKIEKEEKNSSNFLEDEFHKRQPVLFDFLIQPEDLNDDENDLLIDIVETGWYIIKSALKRDIEVSEEYLFEMSERNMADSMIMLSEESSDEDEGRLDEFMQRYNGQPVLMNLLMDSIEGYIEEAGDSLRPEIIPNVVNDLKTAMDCLLIDEEDALKENCEGDYSQDSFNNVQSDTKRYLDEFKKTERYMKLSHDAKDESELVVNAFSEIMYNSFLMVPRNWNGRRTVECCLDILPNKVMAGEKFYAALVPVLEAFMLFCHEKGYVPEGEHIAWRLKNIEDQIAEEFNN